MDMPEIMCVSANHKNVIVLQLRVVGTNNCADPKVCIKVLL